MRDEIYGAFVVLFVAAMLVETLRRINAPEAKLARAYRRTPVTLCSRCAEGTISRLDGVAEPVGPTLHAPASGVPCVAFMLRVVRAELRDQSEPSVVLCEHSEIVAFDLRDASGIARVHPGGSMTLVIGAPRLLRCTFGTAPDAVRKILAGRGFDQREVGGAHAQLECHEVALRLGERASAYGLASWEPDATAARFAEGRGAAAFRDAPKALQLRPTAQGATVVECCHDHAPSVG